MNLVTGWICTEPDLQNCLCATVSVFLVPCQSLCECGQLEHLCLHENLYKKCILGTFTSTYCFPGILGAISLKRYHCYILEHFSFHFIFRGGKLRLWGPKENKIIIGNSRKSCMGSSYPLLYDQHRCLWADSPLGVSAPFTESKMSVSLERLTSPPPTFRETVLAPRK